MKRQAVAVARSTLEIIAATSGSQGVQPNTTIVLQPSSLNQVHPRHFLVLEMPPLFQQKRSSRPLSLEKIHFSWNAKILHGRRQQRPA
jgi:hypothetical protein